MCNKKDWDNKFMDLANFIAGWSKDTNMGVGAVIVNEENTDIVKGYNGFPRGANDDIIERYETPLKHIWTEHAERNAIYKAARLGISTNGCKIYVNYFPCIECSRAIIQAGIKIVIAPTPDLSHHKWGSSWQSAIELLSECNVEIKFFDK